MSKAIETEIRKQHPPAEVANTYDVRLEAMKLAVALLPSDSDGLMLVARKTTDFLVSG